MAKVEEYAISGGLSLGVTIKDKKLSLTNLDKVLWPEEGITKAQFIEYHVKMAPVLLPHLEGRPMVFTRYPNGIQGKSFYQKNIPPYAPLWLKTYEIPSSKRTIRYVAIEDEDSLIWAANQGCIELHPWLSRYHRLDYPDFAVFDFDPMEGTDFEDARKIALALKQLLDIEGLQGFPKTSGATGLQVYVPLEPRYTYEEVREFVYFFCQVLERTFPDISTTERNIRHRSGKLYLDYLQNARGKTIIAPYSPRPVKGASVSCPITWQELEDGAKPSDFSIKNLPSRVEKIGDIFKPVLTLHQNIDRWLQ